MERTRTSPPFRADHVGSLLRPKRLFAARAAWRAGTLPHAELQKLEDECVREAVAMQEGVGLRSITDGDFRRDDWFLDFMFSLEGITRTKETARVPFSDGVDFFTPLARVTGKVRCPAGGITVEDFKFLKSIDLADAEDLHPGARNVLHRDRTRERRCKRVPGHGGVLARPRRRVQATPSTVSPRQAAPICRSTT